MNFKNALSELSHGHANVGEVAKKHHLTAEQVMALRAVSARISELSGFSASSAFVASMMA